MNNVNKVISRKTLKVVKSFTNGFAQQVLWLEDGTQLYISFDDTEVEVLQTEPINDPQEITDIINSTPDEEE
jgi:hypothetical protein